jgi:hypothetical protein
MLLRRWEQSRKANERGSALVAVLGVMVVGLILTTLIVSSVVRAFGFSSSARAAVQSHAAADAGVAAARAGLYIVGNCALQPTPGQYSSTGSLAYTAKVLFDSGSGFTAGCPTLTTTRVQIISTGTAQSAGVAGVTGGNTRTVEATFNYLTPGPHPSGAGIDLYAGGTVEANSSLDLSESGGLVIQHGDLYCDKNNSIINGNVVVSGNLTFDGSCNVNGNATVSGNAALGSSGTITGNLSAASGGPYTPPQVGSYTQTTAIPSTPLWTDVGYKPSDWVDSSGAPFQVMTAPTDVSCTLTSGNLGGTTSPGKAVIINMLGCPGGPGAGQNTSISLTSDVVIFANQFNFSSVNSLAFGSASSSVHRLWLITPDFVSDQQPTCNRTAASPDTQGDFNVKNNLSASDVIATTNTIQAMLYTPCSFLAKNGFTWNGQIYAGGVSYLQNNPTFTFAQIGIAGCDLGTGICSTTVLTSPQPGTLITNRDLAGG